MNISNEKQKQLIHELSTNNSQEALKSIYIAFYPRLFRFVMYYVKSEPVAEEVVCDTFLSIWQQRSQLFAIYNFNNYIYSIARNLAINYLRKKTNLIEKVEISDLHNISNLFVNPESELISSELMNKLNQAVEKLPERCRLVFKLIREENLKYKEVASILNISVKTAEAHMSLAVKRLRETLKNDINE
jgi:RNA polymerase sigma-70 factor (family 1)